MSNQELLTTKRQLVKAKLKSGIRMLPGAPAFQMCGEGGLKSATVEFLILLAFSIAPFFVIALMNWFATGRASLVHSLKEYSSAGEIFFYVGTILGSAFVLLRDNFDDEERDMPKRDLNVQLKRERTWFLFYLLLAFGSSLVVLTIHHLVKGYRGDLVLWVSLTIYITSLYFWFISILYQKAKPTVGLKDQKQKQKDIDSALDAMPTAEKPA